MTAYVTATLHNLLRRSLFPAVVRRSPPRPSRAPSDAETLPMLFRSEGFAEDLLDTHPSH
jgi:hypothetical protein